MAVHGRGDGLIAGNGGHHIEGRAGHNKWEKGRQLGVASC